MITNRVDFLAIFDGKSADSPLIGKYCGTSIPTIIFATGNEGFVWFSAAEASIELLFSMHKGFRLEFMGSSKFICGFIYKYVTVLKSVPKESVHFCNFPLFLSIWPLKVILRHYVVVPLNISTKSLKVNFFVELTASQFDSILLKIWPIREV